MKSLPILCASMLLLASCAEKRPVDRLTDDQLRAYADELAHKYIITDGHIDLPDLLLEKGVRVDQDFTNRLISTPDGEFDYEKSKKGGLDAPFMSIYVPARYQQLPDMGKGRADSLIDLVRAIAQSIPDKFALVTYVEDIEKNFGEGKISLPMGMENGAPEMAEVRRGNGGLHAAVHFFDEGLGVHAPAFEIDCERSGEQAGANLIGTEAAERLHAGVSLGIGEVDNDFPKIEDQCADGQDARA